MWPEFEAYSRRLVESRTIRRISPQRIEPPHAVANRWFAEKLVLLGRANHALFCMPAPGVRRFEGGFGLPPADYALHSTREMRFTIEIERAGAASEVLFERTLRPGTVEEDRGLQAFDVSLPANLDRAEIVLRASLENASDAPAFAYWADLRME
jgi:hypothetical protein